MHPRASTCGRNFESASNIRVLVRTRLVDGGGAHRLESLTLEDLRTGRREEVAAAAVFVLIGAETRTEWIPDHIHRDERGYIPTGVEVPHESNCCGW